MSTPSLRRFAAVALGLTLALTGAACSGGDTADPATTSGGAANLTEPQSGGTLYWAIETNFQTVNPHRNGAAKANPVLRNAFSSYIHLTDDGTYEPWLATYEVSDDGLTYTFDIIAGITFSDGAKLDADAAIANLDAYFNEGYLSSTPDGLKYLDYYEKTGDLSFQITLTATDAMFLQWVSSLGASPLSPAAFDLPQTTLESGGPELAGVGPFVITSYTPGTELVFVRRDDYAWAPASIAQGQTAAYLDSVVYRTFAEGSTRTGALEQGQVQISSDIQPLDVALFEGRAGFQYIRNFVTGTPYALYFNTSRPPFDDVRVREAFIRGADLDAIIQSIYQGAFERAWTPVAERGPWADLSLYGWAATDIDRANQLLDEAGWTERNADGIRVKDGQTLSVRVITASPYVRESREQLNLALAAALRQNVGIDYTYEITDLGTSTEEMNAGNYEIFDNSYGSQDPAGGLQQLYRTGGYISYGQYHDDYLDNLIDTARLETDLDARIALYDEFQVYVTDRFYSYPIYQPQDNLAAADTVHGIYIDATGQPFGAYTIWLEQ